MKKVVFFLMFGLLVSLPVQAAKYDRYFRRYGELYFPTRPWQWFKAQGMAESSLRAHVVSPAGAVGVMQLMPFTAREMGCRDLFDPEMNILCGIRYDHWLWRHFWRRRPYPDDFCLTFASYNAGPGRVRRAFAGNCRRTLPKLPAETRRYVRRIEGYFVKICYE